MLWCVTLVALSIVVFILDHRKAFYYFEEGLALTLCPKPYTVVIGNLQQCAILTFNFMQYDVVWDAASDKRQPLKTLSMQTGADKRVLQG